MKKKHNAKHAVTLLTSEHIIVFVCA